MGESNEHLHGGLINRRRADILPEIFFRGFRRSCLGVVVATTSLWSCFEIILPRDFEWGDIIQDNWDVVTAIADSLLRIVPFPRRRRRLTRSGVILGCYEDGDLS